MFDRRKTQTFLMRSNLNILDVLCLVSIVYCLSRHDNEMRSSIFFPSVCCFCCFFIFFAKALLLSQCFCTIEQERIIIIIIIVVVHNDVPCFMLHISTISFCTQYPYYYHVMLCYIIEIHFNWQQ